MAPSLGLYKRRLYDPKLCTMKPSSSSFASPLMSHDMVPSVSLHVAASVNGESLLTFMLPSSFRKNFMPLARTGVISTIGITMFTSETSTAADFGVFPGFVTVRVNRYGFPPPTKVLEGTWTVIPRNTSSIPPSALVQSPYLSRRRVCWLHVHSNSRPCAWSSLASTSGSIDKLASSSIACVAD